MSSTDQVNKLKESLGMNAEIDGGVYRSLIRPQDCSPLLQAKMLDFSNWICWVFEEGFICSLVSLLMAGS